MRILIIGAGRSATSLIQYLLNHAAANDWQLTVADVNLQLAQEKTMGHPAATPISFDIRNEEQRRLIIHGHDLVISMLPSNMHGDVARDCVEFGKHMATASYVSKEIALLEGEAKKKGLLLLNECGLDPGLDHASAMKMINTIRSNGGKITSFRSYCGGLVAPESNNNPWGYKFSWNPRNVILAGQGTAQYIEEGQVKFIPYNRLFRQTDVIDIDGYGKFEAYANRDSISYIDVYGLQDIHTMLRGTLRQHGYCAAWDIFVKLGLTDDTSKITHANRYTYASLIAAFLPPSPLPLVDRIKAYVGERWNDKVAAMMDYLGILTDIPITVAEGTPAQLLQVLLEEKWKLDKDDKDMIVMQHRFEYTRDEQPGVVHKLESSLVSEGLDPHHTAMSRTVGLPLAITVKNFLTKKFKLDGVRIPIYPEIYEPMLFELESLGIAFNERYLN